LSSNQEVEQLEGSFFSAKVNTETLQNLITNPNVLRIQSKKESLPHLDVALPEIGLLSVGGGRAVVEDGGGVLVGIVDSGFDLSHPMFRDAAGNLRVEALLEQTPQGQREFSASQLSSAWSAGRGPGADDDGHGTHVASIAGGSRFQVGAAVYEGVAPDCRFLLVKTDFFNTPDAVSWIFRKANGRPCVVNMSLGHHWGAHDGTDSEERLHRQLTGSGKLIVISAGNERNDPIHIGGRFFAGQSEEVVFDVTRPRQGAARAALTLWHDQNDVFEATLVTPAGELIPLPVIGQADAYSSSLVNIEIAHRPYSWSNAIEIQISLDFHPTLTRNRDLQNWKLRLTCRTAMIGRLDGWFSNSGFATFRDHRLLESNRTVGLSATGDGCIAVASHVSRTRWDGLHGVEEDLQVVQGRTSPFSSLGPSRDGRWKPDVSAPGQYITAALADSSDSANWQERAIPNSRLLTIEGTSMAAPIITGVCALMLQKRPNLDLTTARDILARTARRDAHSGAARWDPAYGYGKVDVAAALAQL
jgi:subtilisin family serine protease